MKILGFGIIVLGLVMLYIGITGSQHNIMSIIKNGPVVPGGQKINPQGDSGGSSSNGGPPPSNVTPAPGTKGTLV